jgi:hypothetical protein
MRDFAARDVATLTGGNRSWQAYIPPIREGRFDVRIELKAGSKEFLELSDVELWDLAEVLVFHSNALDVVYGIPERNIQLFPTGAVVRPFAVDGGLEKMYRYYGVPVTATFQVRRGCTRGALASSGLSAPSHPGE